MSTSFIKRPFAEVLILLAGALIASAGKQQDSPEIVGLGFVVIGIGVTWGGLRAIRRRRLVFLHQDSRIVTGRYSGGAAMLWGALLSLVGLASVIGGIAVGAGHQAALRAFVMQPGAWLIAGGVALFFASAAVVWQEATTTRTGLHRLLAPLSYLLPVIGIVSGVALTVTGAWGLSDSEGLIALGDRLKSDALRWLDTL
jgi:hypothetical protein